MPEVARKHFVDSFLFFMKNLWKRSNKNSSNYFEANGYKMGSNFEIVYFLNTLQYLVLISVFLIKVSVIKLVKFIVMPIDN